MTNPPHDGTNPPHDGDNEDKPYYPPSNHPEDRTDFGYAGAEQAAYGAYAGSADAGAHAAGANATGASAAQAGPAGKIDVLQAVSWGFSTTFKNAKLWLLIGLIIFLAIIGAAVANFAILASTGVFDNPEEPAAGANATGDAASTVFTLIIMLATLVLAPYLYRLALFQVDDPNTGWGHLWKDTPVLRAIGVMLCTGIVSTILYLVTLLPVSRGFGDAVTGETSIGASELVLMLVGAVAMLVWSIVSAFMQWAAASGQFGFSASFRAGWKIGWNNFGRLLLFIIVANIAMTIFVLITLSLGIIVIMPAYCLMMAHMFRQAAEHESH